MESRGLIDLDVPVPWAAEQGRPRRRVHRLAAAATVVSLTLLLTGPLHLGTSIGPAWQAEAFRGFFWADDDAIYTLSPAGIGLRLIARDPATGRQRWERTLDGALPVTYHAEQPLLVPRFPPFPGSPAATTVLDARTGAEMGTYPVPAIPIVYFAGGVGLTVDRVPGSPHRVGGRGRYDGWSEPHVATAFDVRTGTTRWSRPVPAGSSWVLPGVHPWTEGLTGVAATPGWMAVVEPDGGVETWSLATGETWARGDLGPQDPWSYSVGLSDTLVSYRAVPDAMLLGHDPRTLTPRWQAAMPGVSDGSAWPIECGQPVCLSSAHAIWSIDTAETRLRWHHRVGMVFGGRYPHLPAVTAAGPALIDQTTGRLRLLDGGWRIVETQPGHRLLALSRTDGPAVRLGLLDATEGRVAPLGLVEGARPADQCHVAAARIVCADTATVRAWVIPRHRAPEP